MSLKEARLLVIRALGVDEEAKVFPEGFMASGIGEDCVVITCTDKAAKNRFSRILAAKKSELGGAVVRLEVFKGARPA